MVEYEEAADAELMSQLKRLNSHDSTAKTVSLRVPSLGQPTNSTGVGRGWIQIPGWIRERAAEVLFEDGDEDELSLPDLVLECILAVRSLPVRF